ncbi:GlxA family transcriptional regulator [Lichenihabitans psoromatis]|uniref:GlxA family transcriptional regulator n=1 Tax=Lichenihabitans psoromatis TaxID=2528642 RepID=UPI001A94E9D8|nr:GlxA family transcriptional regulator [Lichenihabitans psoromatis]
MTGEPEQIAFLLVPQFSMLAFLSAVEPLRVANRLSDRDLFAWCAYSADGGPVEASNGMRIMVEAPLSALASCSILIVCAGFEPERHASRDVIRLLQKAARAGSTMGALDTGAFLLARARLLDDVAVTMHWEAVPAFRESFPHIRVKDALYVSERGRTTCAGGSAAIDLMLDRIAATHGEPLAIAIQQQFIHERIRGREDHQRLAPIVEDGANRVGRAVAAMERHLDEPIDKQRLARACGVSTRQFERLFARQTGTSPARHYLGLRLLRARHLLRQTDLSVIQIAAATGFGSASSLSRAYRSRFAVAPREDRIEPSRWSVPLAITPGQPGIPTKNGTL